MGTHVTRDWPALARAARDHLAETDRLVDGDESEYTLAVRVTAERLRTLLDTADATHGQPTGAPTEADPVDLSELRRLHEAATPSPWAWEMTGDKDNTWGVGLVIDDDDQPVVGRNEPGENLLVEPICDGSDHPADADLIVAMRNALPGLLARADEARGVRAVLHEAQREIERLRALVGGRSAAPTRDELQDVIYDELLPYLADPDAEQQEDLEQLRDNVTDAVVALLSLSAAEPPGEQEQEQVRVELTRDDLDGGYVAECVNLPGCVSQGDTVPEALVNLADAYAAIKGGVATEPPEEHGVRLVHPGCEECKQVGRVLVPAPRDDCSCWEGGPEDCRVHGVAAEPPAQRPMDSTPTWTVAAMNGAQDLVADVVAAEPNEEHGDG